MATPNNKSCKPGDTRTYGIPIPGTSDKRDSSVTDDGNNDVEVSDDSKRTDECENSDFENSDGPDDEKEDFANFVSIYKIMNCRFAGLESVSDMQSLKTAIITTLTKSDQLIYKYNPNHQFGDFNVEWFCHCTKEKSNPNSVKISEQLTGSEKSKIPGHRKSGNVQAFYRLKNHQPEIFLLCDGSTYQYILHLADPEFRTNCAKHYIDETNILEIEKYCLAGADLSTCTLFKSKHTIHNIQLEEYIAGITSVIRKDTQLWQLLVEKSGKQCSIGIHIGLNNVRIKIRMGLSTLAAVLDTISSELANTPKTEGNLVQAFENVQRIKDTSKIAELRKLIFKKFLKTIKGDGIIDDLYLSHRFPHDFQTSSSFTLKYIKEKIKEKEKEEEIVLSQWRSVPTLHDVITKLKHHFSESFRLEAFVGSDSNSALGRLLEKNAIKLYFTTPGKTIVEPIQNCIHGCVVDVDTMYYKLSNNWFKFHSSYFMNIDRNFRRLVDSLLFEDDEKDIVKEILKFPWQKRSGIDVEKHCEILNMNNEELKGLLEMLCTSINIIKNEQVCLTEQSFLIPDVAELCKEQKIAREILWACKSSISEAPAMQQVLKKPVQVCCRTKDTFKVMNPVLNEELFSKIVKNFPKLDHKETDVLNFLKSSMKLSEGDFNELFLFCEQPGYIVFPGDRIYSNNIELFDIVIHQNETKRTFLIHTKDKLDGSARISCAQIRNSAELLWHDYVRGHNTHLSVWWEQATNTESGDLYRQLLKKKLERIGEQEFLQMFSDDITIIFVLAFRPSNMKQCLSFDFRPIEANDFSELKHNGDKVFDILVKKKYVTKTGFLSDRLLTLTSAKKFLAECEKRKILTEYLEIDKKKIYSKLKEIGMYNLSTIAKLELLTLDSTFNRFRIGGRQIFKLRLLQLKSR